MRPAFKIIAGAAAVAPALILPALLTSAALGNEPGRIGRFFRFGQTAPAAPSNPHAEERAIESQGSPIRMVEPGSMGAPSATTIQPRPRPQPRLVPQPGVTRAVTDADPLVTRISLARSDDGHSFGMFLQVYADGTVIDGEGVHSLGKDAVKAIYHALESGDLYRVRGHCGGPSTDFVEQVQMVVYERSFRGLRANAFSFSGNTQGCDHAVQHLQKALDEVQAKMSRTVSAAPNLSAAPAFEPPPTAAPIMLNADSNGGR